MCCGNAKYQVSPAAPSAEAVASDLVDLIRRGPKVCAGMAQPKASASAAAATITVTSSDRKPTAQAPTRSRSLSAPKDEAGYIREFSTLLAKQAEVANRVFTNHSIFGTSLASTILLKACEYGRTSLVLLMINDPVFDIGRECRGTSQGLLALHETVAALVDPRTSTVRKDVDAGVHFECGLGIIRILVEQGHVNPHSTARVPGHGFELVEMDAYAAIPEGAGLTDAQRAQVREALDAYVPAPETAAPTGVWGCCAAFWQACCCCCSGPEEAAVASAS